MLGSLATVDEVDLAIAQRADGDGGIGDDDEFDAVDLRHLAAGEAARRLVARGVIGVLLIDDPGGRLVFRLDEAERPRSDDLADRRERIGHRLLLAHDPAGDAVAAAEQKLDETERLLEAQGEGTVVNRFERGDALRERLDLAVAQEQALQRRDDIAGGQLAAIAELEPVPQNEGIEQLVVRNGPTLDQLRPWHHVGVPAEERVIDQGHMHRGQVDLRLMRVEHLDLALRHDAQHLLRRLRHRRSRRH